MPLIKRYPNRKLYDTEAKQYITLEGIADLIRQGEEITVIDHSSGEDQTALTLTQIILEQEKKQSGLLPLSVLAGLIQAGGDRLSALQRALATPINFWHQFDEEMRQRIQVLIKRGDLSEREGQNLLEKLLNQNPIASRVQQTTEVEIVRILTRQQVPTQQDLQRLNEQLEALSKKLDEVAGDNFSNEA
jgi:polyhydroxyalkanoate synthesis repressor PhaR